PRKFRQRATRRLYQTATCVGRLTADPDGTGPGPGLAIAVDDLGEVIAVALRRGDREAPGRGLLADGDLADQDRRTTPDAVRIPVEFDALKARIGVRGLNLHGNLLAHADLGAHGLRD